MDTTFLTNAFHIYLWVMVGLAVVVFVALQFFNAGYGLLYSQKGSNTVKLGVREVLPPLCGSSGDDYHLGLFPASFRYCALCVSAHFRDTLFSKGTDLSMDYQGKKQNAHRYHDYGYLF